MPLAGLFEMLLVWKINKNFKGKKKRGLLYFAWFDVFALNPQKSENGT